MAFTKEQLDAYIQALYDDDGQLSSADNQKIINYILSNGEPEANPRDLIQIRRGLKSDLPNFAQGEMGFALDTKDLYIGGTNGNERISPKNVVNVKDFGAIGEANFYDPATKQFYVNFPLSGVPRSDVDAVNNAIQYALDNGIDTVYFPKGKYYLPNWSYDLDISKLRFVGTNESALCSTGLVSGYFIKLVGPIGLNQYDTAKSPLENIALWGSYNTGVPSLNVVGLLIGSGPEVSVVHDSFKNVVIKDFNVGLKGGQTYKAIFYNLSIIACGYGIFLESGSAIPLYFIGGFIEACGIGYYSEGIGWSNVVFVAFSFEYNRQQVNCSTRTVFNGCRFESDPLSTTANVFQLNAEAQCAFNSCDFLFLPNYVANISNWIDNPAQFLNATVGTPLFSVVAKIVNFIDCKIGVDNSIPFAGGFYKISGLNDNLGMYNVRYSGLDVDVINPLNYKPWTETLLKNI